MKTLVTFLVLFTTSLCSAQEVSVSVPDPSWQVRVYKPAKVRTVIRRDTVTITDTSFVHTRDTVQSHYHLIEKHSESHYYPYTVPTDTVKAADDRSELLSGVLMAFGNIAGFGVSLGATIDFTLVEIFFGAGIGYVSSDKRTRGDLTGALRIKLF